MVISVKLIYQNENQLKTFIEEHELSLYPVLFIQAFVCRMNKSEITNLVNTLKRYLPQAIIVGCHSEGQIECGFEYNGQSVITFTTFEKTNVRSNIVDIGPDIDMYQFGQKHAADIITSETKVMIIYVAQFKTNISEILNGIYDNNPDVTVIGCNIFNKTLDPSSFIFTENGITENGVAFVTFDNHDLVVDALVNGDWHEIGLPFTATKANGPILFEVNGKKTSYILKQYLGNRFVKRLPVASQEIPFLITRNGEKEAIFIQNILDNGSVELSDPIFEGEKFTFALENIEYLAAATEKGLKKLIKNPIEAIFSFHRLSSVENLEFLTKYSIDTLKQIAPVSGIYCNGEIGYRTSTQSVISSPSYIYLTLSESVNTKKSIENIVYPKHEEPNKFMSLTNLTNAIAKDFETINENILISSSYYQAIYENNMDIVYLLDLKGNFTSVNNQFEKAIGYTFNELKGKSSLKLVIDEDIQKAQRHFRKSLNGKIQFYNVNIKKKDGTVESFHIKNIPVMVDGNCVGVYGIGRDISENIKFEEKLTQLANYDEGTGLPNRAKSNEIIDEMLQRAKKKRRSIALLFLDIDRFKMINDTLGHYAGDLMLKELANRLKNGLSNGAYVGRFTSDKFSILLTKESNPESIIQICKQLLKMIEKPIVYQKKEFYLTASIGISMYPYDGDDSSKLLKNADIALSRAKMQGGNGIVFFSDEMNKETLNRVELESHLRKAISKNELFLTYQPIIESTTNKMKSCEALIRWNHPERGIIPPFEFIPLAEETGVIHSIGRWVLKTACKQMKEWHNEGLTDASISINVSATQFQNRWFIEDVKNALAYSDLDPEYLHLELTETVMLHDSLKTIDTMHVLRNIGVKISIDDFGTGYSSLSYLRHLPIHILKIDKSFIQNLDVQTPDYAIVNSIMTMGQGLGLQVIAEGVETDMQLEILKHMNCHFIQGYLIEKPMHPVQMREWIQKFKLSIQK